MSKYEYVQVFFTMKKIWPNSSGSYYWRGELASQPSGNKGVKEGGGNKTSIFGGLQGGLGFCSIYLFEQSHRYHQ